MDILGDTKIDFLGKRKIAAIFSAVMMFIGFVAVISMAMGKANLGTDFAGGTQIQLRFDKPYNIEDMRHLLSDNGFPDAALQEITNKNKLMIKLKTDGQDTAIKSRTKEVKELFTNKLPENPYTVDLVTEVGPTVGQKLQKDALMAVLVSLIGILFYVAWRFEFRFGVAAVCATFHDVLVVLGILYIFNLEINLLIVTALLTLAGYSLTDTVVVFDRVRENLKKGVEENIMPLINQSINEVLRRTIVTSFTTLLVLIALIVKGGEVINGFALTLSVGVIIGTYSSIFVASPILLLWKKSGKLTEEKKSSIFDKEGGVV